jgi:hypothetical protein
MKCHINKEKQIIVIQNFMKKQYLPFGCSVILGGLGVANRSLSLVVAWSRVILGFLGVVNWGTVR